MARKYDYDDEEIERESSGGSNKLAFLLVGGGIGAALALLFAPKSGRELRGDIADASRKGLDKSREKANQLRDNSGVYYEQIKGRANTAYNRASEVYTTAAGKLRRGDRQATNHAALSTSDDQIDQSSASGETDAAVEISASRSTTE